MREREREREREYGGRRWEANCGGRCSDGWRGDGRRWGEEGGKKLGESFREEKVFLKMKMFWGKEEWRMGKKKKNKK